MVLTEIDDDGFHHTFRDSQPLSDIHESDTVYAIEVPEAVLEDTSNFQLQTTRYLMVLLLHKQGAGSQGKRYYELWSVSIHPSLGSYPIYLDTTMFFLVCKSL